MRVIFDRSAFHGDRCDVLVNCSLSDLVRRNRIRVFHTPVFLEETMATLSREGLAGDWRRHLSFALDICNGGLFEEKMEIWHGEIVQGRGRYAKHLMSERRNRRRGSRPQLFEMIRRSVESGEIMRDWRAVETERAESARKRDNQLSIAKDIRRDVSAALKRLHGGVTGTPSFSKFRDSEMHVAGKHLMKLVSPERQSRVCVAVGAGPGSISILSRIRGRATVRKSLRGGGTKQENRFQCSSGLRTARISSVGRCFLSNDTRFLRDAFMEIWRPRGKRLETAESFAMLVNKLG